MAMQGTAIALHCSFVSPTMDLRFLSTGSGATRYTFIRPPKTGGYYSYRVSTILMLTDYNSLLLQAPALQIHLYFCGPTAWPLRELEN